MIAVSTVLCHVFATEFNIVLDRLVEVKRDRDCWKTRLMNDFETANQTAFLRSLRLTENCSRTAILWTVLGIRNRDEAFLLLATAR